MGFKIKVKKLLMNVFSWIDWLLLRWWLGWFYRWAEEYMSISDSGHNVISWIFKKQQTMSKVACEASEKSSYWSGPSEITYQQSAVIMSLYFTWLIIKPFTLSKHIEIRHHCLVNEWEIKLKLIKLVTNSIKRKS